MLTPGTVPVKSVSESPNEEAALSLLALNRSSEQLHAGNVLSVSPGLQIPVPCTASQGDASCNLLTEANRPLHSVAQKEPTKSGPDPSGFNSPVKCAPAIGKPNETDGQGIMFDPIVIKNKKSIKLVQNNPNIEIIVLPPIHTQYQHILPKPTAQSPSQRTPIPTGSESFTFVKPSPQQVAQIEAQKFFEPMKRPYHQQLKMADQLYLIDASPKELPESKVPSSPTSKSKPKPNPVQSGEEEKEEDVKSECFLSWDQKIRQSMVTEFKPPEPPGKKKKEKARKPSKSTKPRRKSEIMDFSNLTEGEIEEYLDKADEDGKRQYKKWMRRRKKVEKGSSKNKSKKKKRKKKEESREKIPITPEFVDESSEDDSGKTRNRHFSESDSLMADTLLKTLKAGSLSRAAGEELQASTPKVSINPLAPPDFNETPVALIEGIKPIRFMEENANSSFDILDSSRPKPVVIPANSANSCSCHSVHQRETGKCTSGRSSFSFKDQEGADSPRYYNENSNSVTVSSLFPSLSSSPASRGAHQGPRIRDTNYRSPIRSPVQEEESDATEEEEEEVREQTSTLPPLESQERDLLESSDEESREETRSETKQKSLLKPAKRISQLSNLSESDMDSPIKNPKLKQPLLLVSKQRLHLLSTSGESCEDRKLSEPLHQPRRSTRVRNLSATAGTLTGSDSDQSLPSMHMHSDGNDSQELVIDGEEVVTCHGEEVVTCHGDTGAVETVVTEDEGGVVGAAATHRPQLAHCVEDSCDSWYANIPNKMKTSFTCHLCKKTFPSLAVLAVHADNCTKMFLICSNCGKKCSSKSGLTLHKKSCLKGDTSTTPSKVNGKYTSASQPKSKGKDTPTAQLKLKGKDTPTSQPRFRGKEASIGQPKLKGKDKRKSSSENSKIKISPTKPSKKVKKRKVC